MPIVPARPTLPRGVAVLASAALISTLAAGCTSSSGGTGGASSSAGGATGSTGSTAPGTGSATTTSPAGSRTTTKTTTRTTAPAPSMTTERPVPVHTQAPVPLSRKVEVDGKVQLSLAALRSVHVAAHGPGEIAGPALAVTVRVVNDSRRRVDVSHSSVNVIGADGQVGEPSSEAPAHPFTGSVAPGHSAEATYVFRMSDSVRRRVDIYVSYAPAAPVAHFHGNAA